MCRFDPALQAEVAKRKSYLLMIMNNRMYKGYCYVTAESWKARKDFEYC